MPTSDATLRAGEMKKALLEQIDHYAEDLQANGDNEEPVL